ncbi:MAG TPA: VOC family protein [Candidatus Acidoferrum sp.]|nr:VOC family protein [Candidatus Acidoferrum sp.]
MLTRRRFLLASGIGLAAFSLRAEGTVPVPAVLDHILLGCPDLDQGVAFVESHLGVRAAFGGVHPGRGTQNALLSLGDHHYLEIIARDPAQHVAAAGLLAKLASLKEPRLIGWAAHPGDLTAYAKRLHHNGIAFEGPTPGSRKRPDGKLLQWSTLNLDKDDAGLLPFFIEWSSDSRHPSADAPQGCRCTRFELATPDLAALQKTLAMLSLDVAVAKSATPQLRATFQGPAGELGVTS